MFWTSEYILSTQCVVPELEIICNRIKYHNIVWFYSRWD